MNRQVLKRLHVRVEHIRKSNCREKFIERVKENDRIKKEAKAQGKKAITKRLPAQPRVAEVVKPNVVEFQHPEKFVIIV
jgi:large subunit ribosomal protein L21e